MIKYDENIKKLSLYKFLGPIFERQHSDLRLNVKSAKFVEALISDSWGAGFKNEDNIKPGHRNIYLNGGEHHPYCNRGSLGRKDKMSCRHTIPVHLLIYLNNHVNGNPSKQCLVNYVCPETVTADDLAPFNTKSPDEKEVIIHATFHKNILSLIIFPCTVTSWDLSASSRLSILMRESVIMREIHAKIDNWFT